MGSAIQIKVGAWALAAWAQMLSRGPLLRSILSFAHPTRGAEQPVSPSSDKAVLSSILVVSIPKSGTVFANLILSRGLSLEQASVSLGYFPHELFESSKRAPFVTAGKVASIQDPRSVELSCVQHMNCLYAQRPRAFLVCSSKSIGARKGCAR